MAATAQVTRSIDRTSGTSPQRWVTVWGQAVFQMPAAFGIHRIPAGTLSLRVPLGAGGDSCRVSLSNRYGSMPVRVDAATLTFDDGAASSFAFESGRSVVIPAGGSLVSDPLRMTLPAGGVVRLTVHLPEGLELTTVNRVETDEWTTAPCGTPEMQGRRPRFLFAGSDQLSPLPLLAAFDVRADGVGAQGAVLAFGDSITAGGWPAIASNQREMTPLPDTYSFVNAGISGNRLLRAGAGDAGSWFGAAGVSRLEEILTTTSGVDELIVLIGVNDLLQPGVVAPAEEEVTSAELIDGYRELLAAAMQFGVRSTRFCTILPFSGAEGESVERERVRCEVNDWIRHTPGFVDTATALAGADITRLRKDFDSGDHLHPNDAGQAEIAMTVRRRLAAD